MIILDRVGRCDEMFVEVVVNTGVDVCIEQCGLFSFFSPN